MANSRPLKRFFSVASCPPTITTGVWTNKVTSNILSANKAAAATNSVVNFSLPKTNEPGAEDRLIKSVTLVYSPTTADLTSAPSAVVNKLTTNLTTGAVARAAVTQSPAIAFAGTDTVGKTATGTYLATVTIGTPAQIGDNEELVVSFTMGEAATSVLDIYGIIVDYSG